MVDEFMKYMQYERNRSARTLSSYGESLKLFEQFFTGMDAELTWQTVDVDVIRDWMADMMSRGATATTVNARLSAVRSLYRFALSRGMVGSDPAHNISGPKKKKPLPQYVRENEINRLLDDCPWGANYASRRARMVIMTFYETGMRASELIGLDDGSVDFAARQLKVLGKRNKERLIPFGAELERELHDFMTLRDKSVERTVEKDGRLSTALFLSDKGRRMSYSQVRRMVVSHLRMVCTLKKCSPHVLRHSFATAMLNHHADLESVKQLLGHESIATTEIYTHTTFEQLMNVYMASHPRAGDS